MKLIQKVLTVAFLVPIALAGANSLAAPQPGNAADKDEVRQPTLPHPQGDYAVIERVRITDGVENFSRITLPWDAYEQKYGYDQSYEPPVQIHDEYEDIVPTPRPPAAGGFSPDDTTTLFRSAFLDGSTYDRTTVYVMTSSGWARQSNSVEVTGGQRGH